MKRKKLWMTLLTAAVVLMALSLSFAAPSGAILTDAKLRYQDEAPIDWGDDEDEEEEMMVDTDFGASLGSYRVIASGAESDVSLDFGTPEPTVNTLDLDIGTVGSAPIEANFTDTGYQDDTMTVEIQEIRQDDSIYHVVYVTIASPTQLRTYVAGGVNSTRTSATTTLAQGVNAVVAVNGDFYSKFTGGWIVRQGVTIRKKISNHYDLLLVDENADFHLLLAGKANQKDGITAFLKEHEMVNAFFFGPALVMDGEICQIPEDYGWNPSGREPRAAIGQLGPLSYVVVTVDGRIDDSAGVTLPTLAGFMAQIGCTQAYNLDGGNSSALVYHGEMLSIKGNYKERSVNDIIYFASATQEGAAE